MSPPELARYTPVTEVIDPVFECLLEPRRDDFEVTLFISFDDFFRKYIRSYEPLGRYDRLYTALTPLTESYFMLIGFYTHEISLRTKELYDIFSCICICLLSGKSSSLFIHIAISIYDCIVSSKIMSFCCLKVCRIMCRSDLHNASTKLHIDHLVSDYRDFFIYYREYDGSSYKLLVSLIFWMYC